MERGARATVPQSVAESSKMGSDVKLVGTVSAGQLSSPLAVRLGSRSAAALTPAATLAWGRDRTASASRMPASAPTVEEHETSGPQSISAQEAYVRWQEWVGEVTRERISVGTVLRDTTLLDLNNGALRISCPDDYHVSSLNRHRDFLGDSFRKLTGQSVRIEPVLETGSRVHTAAPSFQTMQASSSGGSGIQVHRDNNGTEHPVVAALRRELGAEAVE